MDGLECLLIQGEYQLVPVERGISMTESVNEGLSSSVRPKGEFGPKPPSPISHI